jgi:hypothetical protein
MQTHDLKENFQNQLKEIDEKISQIQGELTKAQEYKLKLQGGLETLELLEKSSQPNILEDMPDLSNIPPPSTDGTELQFPDKIETEE